MVDGKKNGYYEYDVLVVGSGIAGLFATLKAAEFARVCLLTKEKIHHSNTWLAQGGIAAAIGEDDSPKQHLEDTLAAGAGLCPHFRSDFPTQDASWVRHLSCSRKQKEDIIHAPVAV